MEGIRLIANNPKKAELWLQRQLRDIPKQVNNYQRLSDDVTLAVKNASTIRKSGPKAVSKMVREVGGLAVHIPFTNKHGYLLNKGVGATSSEIMRSFKPIDNMLNTYTHSALSKTVREAAEKNPNITALEAFEGSQAKLAAYTMMDSSNRLLNIPLHGWDIFRRAFGSHTDRRYKNSHENTEGTPSNLGEIPSRYDSHDGGLRWLRDNIKKQNS